MRPIVILDENVTVNKINKCDGEEAEWLETININVIDKGKLGEEAFVKVKN